MTQDPLSPAPSREKVWLMFDRIASRYDLLNRILSFGQDIRWRKKVARHLKEKNGQFLLDMATGTADQILFLLQKSQKIESAIGMDMSEKMLEIGREKIKKRQLDNRVELKTGDATDIPATSDTFDVVTITFGIRNVIDVQKGLGEMYRVLKPGGRALILEFSLPKNRLFRSLYLFYFRHILPKIGGLLSGDSYAYSYLNQTVETFPYGEAFCELMRHVHFQEVKGTPLWFGIATIYQGDKPEIVANTVKEA